MRIISIINYKGGVGKTTLTANLAAELALRGKRILMMDMDAQCSLTFSFVDEVTWHKRLSGELDDHEDHTIRSWFSDIVNERAASPLGDLVLRALRVRDIIGEFGGCLHLIPSHLGLINIDLDLAYLIMGHPNRIEEKKANVNGMLKGHLKDFAVSANYDYVLIDCPPNFNIVTKNAIVASDYILIPAKPDYLSTLGITYLQRNLDELINHFNSHSTSEQIEPEILGVIYTMIQIRNGPISAQRQYMHEEYMETGENSEPLFIFSSTIRENKTLFADAPEERIPVVLKRPNRKPYDEIIEEIKELGEEFLSLLDALEELKTSGE